MVTQEHQSNFDISKYQTNFGSVMEEQEITFADCQKVDYRKIKVNVDSGINSPCFQSNLTSQT